MGFILSQLVVESILNDGLDDMRDKIGTTSDQISDVFSELAETHLSSKYGTAELTKIENLVKSPLKIIYGYSEVQTTVPCISLHLLSSKEDLSKEGLDNFAEDVETDITPTTIVSSFNADSYNSDTGIVSIPDSVDLSSVFINLLLVDGDGDEFAITGGISDVTGSKTVGITPDSDLDNLTGCYIKSTIDFERYSYKFTYNNESILIGIHTKNALETIYLYTIVNYILMANKETLINRGFDLINYSGSDFDKDQQFAPEQMYTKYLTLNATTHNTWKADQQTIVENIELDKVRTEIDEVAREDGDDYSLTTTEE